jgi:hypothetical protein
MTSIHGTNTQYDGLSDFYYSLSLTPGDKIFGTGFGITQGGPIEYDDLVRTMHIKEGQENNFDILQSYQNLAQVARDSFRAQKLTQPRSDKKTVYSVLSTFEDLSEFKKLVDVGRMKEYLEDSDQVTLIVPTNEALREAQGSWFTMHDPKLVREFIRAHTLGFDLPYERILGRRLELYPLYEGLSYVVDGTGQFRDYINFYQKRYRINEGMYPSAQARFKLLKIFKSENGSVYVIDGAFDPEILI